jgi:hypothetical protein
MLRTLPPAILVILVVSAPSLSWGQPSLSASLGQGVESLAAPGAGSDAQGELAGAARLEYAFAAERARVGYDVDVTTYAVPGDWRSVSHVLSGRYRFDAGSRGRASLFVGGETAFRRNGSAWDAADFDAAGAFANYELKPSDTSSVRAGYRLDVRRFRDIAGLDHLEQAAFGSVRVNLPSRTTLIGEVAVGAKHYRGGIATVAAVAAAVPTTAAGASGGTQGTGIGAGRGPASGFHDTWSSLPTVAPTVDAIAVVPSSDARTVTVFARVAQSLAARTGVTFDVTRRLTFGEVPSTVVSTPARFFDDGVYDDPFASDATDLRAGLTSIFTGEVEMKAVARWLDKPYGATTALDDTGMPIAGTLRHDRVARGALFVTVPLAPSRTGAFDLSLVGGYDYTHHESTTAAYNYASHAVRLGFSVEY